MQKSKAALFLIELLIALLFFSVASAICLQLFVGAHNANKYSDNMSHASMLCSYYAEDFFSSKYAPDFAPTCYYTDSLNETEYEDAVYCVATSFSYENNYLILHVSVSNLDRSEIYVEQDFSKYKRRTLSDVESSENQN